MTPEQAAEVVGWVAAGFGRNVAEETATVWIDGLLPYNPRAGKAAAHRAPLELTKFPSLAEFLDLCDEEAKRIAVIDAEAGMRLGLPAPEPDPATGSALGRHFTAWMDATVEVVALGGRHTDLCGAKTRPTCLPGCDFMLAVQGRYDELVEERKLPPKPDEQRFFKCRECWDTGFVYTEGQNVGRPCQLCRPESWRLWAEGHYAPNHDCEECAERRRRRGNKRERAES